MKTITQAIDETVRALILAERKTPDPVVAELTEGMTLAEMRALRRQARVPLPRRVTHADVAEAIGEAVGSWRRYVCGDRMPGTSKVEGWAQSAGLVLVFRDGGWTVRRAWKQREPHTAYELGLVSLSQDPARKLGREWVDGLVRELDEF